MKRMILMVAAAVIVASPVLAFHDGGVAHCNGCHTMHNSQDGQLVDPDSPNGNPWLLVDASPSDLCIACHDSIYRGVFNGTCETGGLEEHGAGNFIFLTCDELNDGHGSPIPGDAAGHNVDAPGYGLAADLTLTTAPGGTFPGAIMGCTSCHDPHGTDAFRLLYGIGPVAGGAYTFTNPSPVAEGVELGRSSHAPESPTNHTAYHAGMSQWCGNCHADYVNVGTTHKHRTDVTIGGTFATLYNLYNGSDDLLGGAAASAYLPEVPFQDADDTTYTTSSTQGPTGSSQIMCLTCHRSHASSGPDAGRWDFNITFLEEDGHTSGSYALPNPYDSIYAQRGLCNKCHRKDEFDELVLDTDL